MGFGGEWECAPVNGEAAASGEVAGDTHDIGGVAVLGAHEAAWGLGGVANEVRAAAAGSDEVAAPAALFTAATQASATVAGGGEAHVETRREIGGFLPIEFDDVGGTKTGAAEEGGVAERRDDTKRVGARAARRRGWRIRSSRSDRG